MSIFTNVVKEACNGQKIKIDLVNKSLWVNKKQIIEKGVVLNSTEELIEPSDLREVGLVGFDNLFNEEPWQWIETLYDIYKYSVPAEYDNKKGYFGALSLEELSDADLAYNYSRKFAQVLLEGYVLLASMQGWLQWENESHWFWQSTKDKELVVLREWIS